MVGAGKAGAMFKKLRGVKLAEKKQGLIFYICANYADMSPAVQKRIEQLCLKIGGGEYYKAIFDVMTGKTTIKEAALLCPCDETTLRRKRRAFYEAW